MFWKFVAALLTVSCSWGVAHAGCPGQAMSTGWCWPVNPETLQLRWGLSNDGFSGYHLAQDIKANEGDPVYSIWRGYVKAARTNVSNYGGASNCSGNSGTSISGAGIIIRHKTSMGEEFDVLYAHLKNLTVSVGDEVGVGQQIGEIRNYTWCGRVMNHLHFGVEYPARTQAQLDSQADIWAGYGTTDRGFVDPLLFLRDPNHKPPLCKSAYGTCQMKKVGNMLWYPADSSCTKASQWFSIDVVAPWDPHSFTYMRPSMPAFCPQTCPSN